MKINIITPCSRPQNLPKMKGSINFPCEWWIVFDNDIIPAIDIKLNESIHLLNIKLKSSGNAQRNLALDNIKEGWIYFLDDDNVVHPNFYKTTEEILRLNNHLHCIFYSQEVKNGYIRNVNTNTIKVNYIDQAQFLLSREIIGNRRYIHKYEADGIFIQELYNENKNRNIFYFHNDSVVTYYNKLLR